MTPHSVRQKRDNSYTYESLSPNLISLRANDLEYEPLRKPHFRVTMLYDVFIKKCSLVKSRKLYPKYATLMEIVAKFAIMIIPSNVAKKYFLKTSWFFVL